MKKQEIQKIPKTPLKFLWHVTQPHLRYAFWAFLFLIVASTLGSGAPYFFRMIIDSATETIRLSSTDFSQTWLWVGLYGASIVVMAVSWRASGFIGIRWVTQVVETALNELLEWLSQHSHSYFSNRFAGALTNKVGRAADGTGRLADHIVWSYFPNLISLIVTGVLTFVASTQVGLIYVALVILLCVTNFFFVRYRRPFVVEMSKQNSILRGQAVDMVTNIQALKQFARRSFELEKLGEQAKITREADAKQSRLMEYGLLMNNTITTLAVISMLVIMLKLLVEGEVSLGDFVMVVTLMYSMQGTLTFIGNMMNGFIRVYGDIQDGLNEILTEHDLVDVPGAKDMKVQGGAISYKDVTFTYEDDPIFQKFNLEIPAGQRVGVVGPSGAGKTTLISLLMRQFDIEAGSLKVDGQELSQATQDSLRENIGIVPQEPLLFHRSIRENIRYGKLEATDEEVEEAAKAAQAHDFILDAPDGYDTMVGERGIKLSGGQKQRVAIARAILKNAPILILDEATSSLDSESEVKIQEALHTLMQGKTVIAVAHRFSTIREMDRIIVMDKGKVVQDGNHDSLVKEKDGIYAKLWAHQSDGFM